MEGHWLGFEERSHLDLRLDEILELSPWWGKLELFKCDLLGLHPGSELRGFFLPHSLLHRLGRNRIFNKRPLLLLRIFVKHLAFKGVLEIFNLEHVPIKRFIHLFKEDSLLFQLLNIADFTVL